MPGQPITELCREPRTTRNAARAGLPTPCHRCLAYRPLEPLGCALMNATREEKPKHLVADQTSIWPTHKD